MCEWFCENVPSPHFLLLNSPTSVRVFTRMVSDNRWCSLWASSSLSGTSNVTLIFSCLHIHERTSLSSFKMTLKFNKLLRLATTVQSAASFTGIVRIFCAVYNVWRGSSQVDAGKYKLIFCLPRYQYSWCIGSYMYMFLRSSNSLHSILPSVLCKKWSNMCWNSMLWGSGVSVGPHGHVSANRSKVINSRCQRFLFTCRHSFSQTLWRNMK